MSYQRNRFIVTVSVFCILFMLVLSACAQSTNPAPKPTATATKVASIPTEQSTATQIANPNYCDSLNNFTKPVFDLFINNLGSSKKLVLNISLNANQIVYFGGSVVHATSNDWLGDQKLNVSSTDYVSFINNFPEQTQHTTYHFHIEVTNGFIAVVENPNGDSFHPTLYLLAWAQTHGLYLYNLAIGSIFENMPLCLYPNAVLVP